MKKRPLTTLLKHLDIQIIDKLDDMIENIDKDTTYLRLVYDY